MSDCDSPPVPFFFWSRRKFAFQCLREWTHPRFSRRGFFFRPIFGWNNPENVKRAIRLFFFFLLLQSTGLSISVSSETELPVCWLSWMYSLAPCVMETFCFSCESATLKKAQLFSSAFCSSEGVIFTAVVRSDTYSLSLGASNNWLSRSARKKTHSTHTHWLPDGEVILCVGRRVSSLTNVCFYLQVCARVYVRAAALMIAVVTLLLWEDRAALTMTEIQVSWKKNWCLFFEFSIKAKNKFFFNLLINALVFILAFALFTFILTIFTSTFWPSILKVLLWVSWI